MTGTRRWLLTPILAALAAGCLNRPAGDPIRIGHLAAFSGPDRARGERAAVLTGGRARLSPGLAEAFVQEWQTSRGAAVYEWNWERDADLADLAQRVAKGQAGVVLLIANPADFRKARQALAEAGVNGP